jgi:hypothetical protein
VVLFGHRLAVVVRICRKEYAKTELPWSRDYESSVLRKVLGQRVADFSFAPDFELFLGKRVRRRRHEDNCKKKKKSCRLATKGCCCTAASDGIEVKSGASKAASLAFDPLCFAIVVNMLREKPLSISKDPVDQSLWRE